MKKILLVLGLVMGSMLVSDAYAAVSVKNNGNTIENHDKEKKEKKKKKKAKKACCSSTSSTSTTPSCCKKKAATPEVAPGK